MNWTRALWIVAAGAAAWWWFRRNRDRARDEQFDREWNVDLESAASFPASDPPSFTGAHI